ncbi:MAG: butyrate kinase [Bacteroidales bacterium]
MKDKTILAVNPGSTSTKFALFAGTDLLFERTLRHTIEELSGFRKMTDQLQFRYNVIMEALRKEVTDPGSIAAVVGRGGLVNPIESGIYEVNELMKKHLSDAINGEHASNLGALLADLIAGQMTDAKAYIVDPVVVDELEPVARLSGHPLISRRSIFHALNQKAVARIYAASVNREYEDLNLIVAHMGGGISVGAHRRGRVIDVNNALNGDGPFSPERSGGLPAWQLAELCFSGKYTPADIKSMLAGKGGIVAYLGTNSHQEATRLADGGDIMLHSFWRVAAIRLPGDRSNVSCTFREVDCIILTGGLAYDEAHVERIRKRTGHLARSLSIPARMSLRHWHSMVILPLRDEFL